MRITIRRDLLGRPAPELLELAAQARARFIAAEADLASTDDLGQLVDAYERMALASRDVTQVHAVLALLRSTAHRGRKGRGAKHAA